MTAARVEPVHVSLLETEETPSSELAAWIPVLSADERARADRFLRDEDKRDYVAAHALLRRALSQQQTAMAPSAWMFDVQAGGKPCISASQAGTPPLTFSLSHTRGLVACAIARGARVGIDLERTDRVLDHERVAERYFASREVDDLRQRSGSERVQRFFELWTLKEALAKASGRGVPATFTDAEFRLSEASDIALRTPRDAWHFFVARWSAVGTIAVACSLRTGAAPQLVISGHSVEPVRWSEELTWIVTPREP